MTPRFRQLRWFGGLYLAALATLAFATLIIRAVLRLIT